MFLPPSTSSRSLSLLFCPVSLPTFAFCTVHDAQFSLIQAFNSKPRSSGAVCHTPSILPLPPQIHFVLADGLRLVYRRDIPVYAFSDVGHLPASLIQRLIPDPEWIIRRFPQIIYVRLRDSATNQRRDDAFKSAAYLRISDPALVFKKSRVYTRRDGK